MRSLAIFLIGLVLMSFTECEQKEVPKANNIICLVDFSSSIPEATAHWYKETIKNEIILKLSGKDKITLLPIDYGSATSSKELFKLDIKDMDFSNDFDPKLQKKELEKNRLIKYLNTEGFPLFDKAFETAQSERRGFSRGTDIIGALKQAVIYKDTVLYKNTIIVFSDMIQETEELNLESSYKKGRELSSLINEDEIDLLGMNIITLTGEQPNMRINKFEAIQAFWQAYFPKQNGQLIDYNSGGLIKLQTHLDS